MNGEFKAIFLNSVGIHIISIFLIVYFYSHCYEKYIAFISWSKIDQSTFCDYYKDIKVTISEEKYLSDRTLQEWERIEWARMRCGNMNRAGQKGWKNKEMCQCRICGKEEESFKHIWNGEKVRGKLKQEGRNWLEAIEKKHRRDDWMIEMLKGKASKGACWFSKEIYKMYQEQESEQQSDQ